jgi:chromosome segregation ATPase
MAVIPRQSHNSVLITGQKRQNLLWMSLGIFLGLCFVATISAIRVRIAGDPIKKWKKNARRVRDRDQIIQATNGRLDIQEDAVRALNGTVARLRATIDAQAENLADLNAEINIKRARIQRLELEAIDLRRFQDGEPELRRQIVAANQDLERLRPIAAEVEDLRGRIGGMRDEERRMRRELQEKNVELGNTMARNAQLVQRMAFVQQQFAQMQGR